MTDVLAPAMGEPASSMQPAPVEDARVAWANEMRKVVTRPDALNDDGSLNQQFFKPKKVVYAAEKAKWNESDWENLYKGIEKYGIDPSSWKKIIDEFCPGREVLFIRIKASRAIGSQGLNRYHGWIGNKVRRSIERGESRTRRHSPRRQPRAPWFSLFMCFTGATTNGVAPSRSLRAGGSRRGVPAQQGYRGGDGVLEGRHTGRERPRRRDGGHQEKRRGRGCRGHRSSGEAHEEVGERVM